MPRWTLTFRFGDRDYKVTDSYENRYYISHSKALKLARESKGFVDVVLLETNPYRFLIKGTEPTFWSSGKAMAFSFFSYICLGFIPFLVTLILLEVLVRLATSRFGN